MTRRCSTSMVVQSVLFRRSDWSAAEARQWLRDHGYRSTKVDVKPHTLRFRQRSPKTACRGAFRVIPFGRKSGIKAVICCGGRAR